MSKFAVTYDAIATDVVDNGADRPVALVVVAEDEQRIIIRMDRAAIARLQARIGAAFTRRKRPAQLLR
jgi:hypothetical protein